MRFTESLGAMTNPLVRQLCSRAGKRLRSVADRIDPDHAPRWSGYTFVLDRNSRPIFWEGRRHDGCMLWYLGHAEREKAYAIETAGHASGGWATSNRFAHVPTSGPVEYSGDWGQTHYDENGEVPNADRPRRHVEDLISDAAKITSPRGGIRYPFERPDGVAWQAGGSEPEPEPHPERACRAPGVHDALCICKYTGNLR